MLPMNNIERRKSIELVPKFELLKPGKWYYNYDIQKDLMTYTEIVPPEKEDEEPKIKTEERECYSFIQVTIHDKLDYSNCVKAVLKHFVDTDAELDLINSYNAYQLGIQDLSDDYYNYLELVNKIKEKVRKDFNVSEPTISHITPRFTDLLKLMTIALPILNLTDEQAKDMYTLFPPFQSLLGNELKTGQIVRNNNVLFRVLKDLKVTRTIKLTNTEFFKKL